MSEKTVVNFIYIFGLLLHESYRRSPEPKQHVEKSDILTRHPLNSSVPFFRIKNTGAIWAATGLDSFGYGMLLDAAYKYISDKNPLLDGIVSDEQRATILRDLGYALLFVNNIFKANCIGTEGGREAYVAIPVEGVVEEGKQEHYEKIIVLKLAASPYSDCVVELHEVIGRGTEFLAEMHEDGKIIFINNSQGS